MHYKMAIIKKKKARDIKIKNTHKQISYETIYPKHQELKK